MKTLKLEHLEGQLVRITTKDNYEFIDYYERDKLNKQIHLESYQVVINENRIVEIERIEDFDFIYDDGVSANYMSETEH